MVISRAEAAASTARAEDVDERFTHLYRELFSLLYSYVRFRVGDVQVAEDLTAQVFERALTRLATVREPERVRAWLFTIARNAITDYRRSHRPAMHLDADMHLAQAAVDSPEGDVLRRDEWRRAVGYLAELGDREREAIGLRFVAGLPNREIGAILRTFEANVAQIVYRAIIKVRRRFDAEERP